MIRIDGVVLLGLIDRIVEFKDLSADKLIIAINDEHDLVIVTVLVSSVVYIFHGSFFESILDKDNLFWPWCFEPQILSYFFWSAVSRSIVNDDMLKLFIVLLQDRFYIPEVPVIYVVIEGWGYDANWKMLPKK